MSMVLVVDDKEMMRDSVAATLARAGFEVASADSGTRALDLLGRRRPDAIVTDLRMPGLTGIDLIAKVREIDADLPIVLMTAFGTIETAVEAIKAGAFDYVTKPFEGDELIISVKRAISHRKTVRENEVLRATAPSGRRGMERLIGTGAAMRRVKEQVRAVADSQGNVLVVGESGTGKEVVARTIHELSGRSDKPFLAVNCAALSESLLESELFGHEKGAFTGADRMRKGRFELADGGTLLLDEISEIGVGIQAKLLRVLQERAFERVGSSVTIGVDVRVIATSNRDLPRAVASGKFRQDLFFRLNVLPIHLPPLRDRPEDVAQLATHFVSVVCQREGRERMELEPDALELMALYGWPGNVRELQNICERAVVLGRAAGRRSLPAELIEPWLETRSASAGDPTDRGEPMEPARDTLAELPVVHTRPILLPAPASRDHGPAQPSRIEEVRPLADIERDVIVQTLRRFNGHRQKTAAALGIGVRTLGLKLKKWKEEKLVEATL